jgi:hypothetical protein
MPFLCLIPWFGANYAHSEILEMPLRTSLHQWRQSRHIFRLDRISVVNSFVDTAEFGDPRASKLRSILILRSFDSMPTPRKLQKGTANASPRI